ncbi:helix-turn-helix domain-containing protein [Parasedimentitalea marina]|uniref:Helix-turn-helix domain-containing protein n=1 Tax=Parasedimentitalea marina TaxID=2483033 RepID=A0A3T0N3T3_9RHOB|nr:helix-turn-helix domain-containing protein [Parasedimentitalea marina]AZV78647.1 helix-turn-helix domain-containing protein [Parasedimentitalea marina]
MTRTIDVLLFDDVNMLDVSGPVQAFGAALIGDRSQYAIRYVSPEGKTVRAACGLRLVADGELSARSNSDDLLIPGGKGVDAVIQHTAVREVIQNRAARKGHGRLISICSGALVLAAAGVLDGRPATTHWSRSADTKVYENVLWDLDLISTSEERIFTSAGVTTGIDLALAIIRADCGPKVALAAARELVVQLRRTGGQSQYAIHLAGQFTRDDTLTRLIEQVVSQPQLDWSLNALSQTAGMNTRTLSRHFQRDMQETPAQFVERVRVDHARGLLSENFPLKQVAADSGFGDLQRMRRAFQRRFGINISEYLSAFG